MGIKGDLKTLETMVRRRYPINAKRAAEVVNDALESEDDRVRMRAATIAAMMEAQNQRDEHKVLDVRVQIRHDQLPGIAADLGIPLSVIEDAAREADSGISDSGREGQ